MVDVKLDPSPDVQLLGDTACIRGAAALDAYVYITSGIEAQRRQNGSYGPTSRLMQVVAALKVAGQPSTASLATLDNRREAPSARLRTGEVLGVEEVARMTGYNPRTVCRLAAELGGWHASTRGRPWRFDRGLVQAYIDQGEQE